jgi:hypothetical protein
MTTTVEHGRLGNQIIRNFAVSQIAKKQDLFVDYCNYSRIKSLGIELYSGKNIYTETKQLTDNNYFDILNENTINYNLDPNPSYFQTKEISNYLFSCLNDQTNRQNIIMKNNYKERYNNNNDCFIHIRLTDVEHLNPGIDYYFKALSNIQFDHLYVASDDVNHRFIQQIIEKYPNSTIISYDEINTIKYGSTCKYIILSHGSFSAIIGFLSFFSSVYYCQYDSNKIWYGDMFSIPSWNKVI